VRKLSETNDQDGREFWSRTLLQMRQTEIEAEVRKAEVEKGKAEAEARKAEAEKGKAEAALEAKRLEEESKKRIIEDLKKLSEARADLVSKTSKNAADEAKLVSLAEQRAALEKALDCYNPQVDLELTSRIREIGSRFSSTRAASRITEDDLKLVLKHLRILLTREDGPEEKEFHDRKTKDHLFWWKYYISCFRSC